MWFPRFKQAYIALALPWLLCVLIQTAGRLHLLLVHSPPGSLKTLAPDIARLMRVGLLFDIHIASILLALCALPAGLLAVSERGFALWRRAWPGLAAALCTVALALTAVNFFYYATYGRPIDVFIFGLAEDDTAAILATVWHDYPVASGSLGLILFAVLAFWLFRRWQRRLDARPLRRSSLPAALLVTLTLLVMTAIGIRGSLGAFPLREDDAQVADVKMLNMFTPNGLTALDWAFDAHKKYNHFPDAPDAAGAALFSGFLERRTPPGLGGFQARTPINPAAEARPPNVVLNVMESMGRHLETLDRPGRDLLGALRPHWGADGQSGDWRFERFISEGDGTIDTLSRLFVRSPASGIGQSTAQATDFASNMIKPYLARGYTVVYVTPGSGAWRNLNQFLPRLGVGEFMDASGLKRLYPEASESAWGVPDEFMFRYIETRLERAEQEGKPVLVISMSITLHPPYQAPPGHPRTDFDLSEVERERLAHLAQGQNLNEMLNTLRYANDQLGRFIGRIKARALGQHTLIAVTGDHNIRGIGYPDPRELALGHAVPFYLYAPPAYRGASHFDPARVGSHKDIWPTLYALSLSDTPYYRTGCDLLAAQPDPLWCGGYNPEVAITAEGAYTLRGPAEFRPWAAAAGLMLGERRTMTPAQQAWQARWSAYTGLLQWQINRQVHQQP
jgi:phosphoglycerol transferase MdoB-like AlkP superfamily enzyme